MIGIERQNGVIAFTARPDAGGEKEPTIIPKRKAAREGNNMGRQDIFACPVELSGERHDRSLAAEADIVSAVRPKIAAARIQPDDASARVHHMSVAVER